jgi:hypothetical protein
MNQDLSQIITCYATKPHRELSELLLSKSKDNLIAMLTDLFTAYIKDKNSSSLREYITVSIAGYKHNPNKLGYNGFKQASEIGGAAIACEAKPKNIQTDGYQQKKTKPKLNGEGGYNDYTYDRLQKDMAANPNILSSGFVDGQLLYVVEFPFAAIAQHLQEQVPQVRQTGQYTRYATFNYSHYAQHPDLKIIYINKEAAMANSKYFNQKFYNYLIGEPCKLIP